VDRCNLASSRYGTATLPTLCNWPSLHHLQTCFDPKGSAGHLCQRVHIQRSGWTLTCSGELRAYAAGLRQRDILADTFACCLGDPLNPLTFGIGLISFAVPHFSLSSPRYQYHFPSSPSRPTHSRLNHDCIRTPSPNHHLCLEPSRDALVHCVNGNLRGGEGLLFLSPTRRHSVVFWLCSSLIDRSRFCTRFGPPPKAWPNAEFQVRITGSVRGDLVPCSVDCNLGSGDP